jgi:hypothetical protein
MKYFLIALVLLASCTKEPADQRMVQLTVEGNGNYLITYGTSDQVTVEGEDKWSTILSVSPGDTIKSSVQTEKTAAILYLSIQVQEGLLFCKSLYIEPESVGSLNYVVDP